MAHEAWQPLPGMADIGAPEVFLWQRIEAIAREVFARYGLTEVRTPILEWASLFRRAIGDATDIVQKEMYLLEDRGGREMALRPEGTAGVIRHAAGRAVEAAEARLYYLGPMFRAERPQAGRRRQFHQIGVELLGPASPAADTECIALLVDLLQAVGLSGFVLRLNTRGGPNDIPAVSEGMRAVLRPAEDRLCEDCRRRMATNPLRVLDCKQSACRAVVEELPPITDFMVEESRRYFETVCRLLERLSIPFASDRRLVRGLDYYAHTVWEITHPALGAQDAVAGGGRYALPMGESVMEGVGFAIGMERLVMALQASGVRPDDRPARPRVWLVAADATQLEDLLVLLQVLRRHGIAARMDLAGRSLKAQMRAANRSGATWAVIRGGAEAARGIFLLKHMETGVQEEVALDELMQRLKAS